MEFYQATVVTTSEFADTLSVILMEYGSEGVAVTDFEDVKRILSEHNWDYVDESVLAKSDTRVFVCGYYPVDYDFSDLTERLEELKRCGEQNVGSLELSIVKLDSGDYENEWKKYYEPIELGRIVIVPEWIRYTGNKLQVSIDPGMAFGTGNHETTRLCLGFLEELQLNGKKVADVGCGSGILGAAALVLGASYCRMVDIDEQAVEAAKKNCERSGVLKNADIRRGYFTSDGEKYSVIVANITADVLIGLVDTFYDSLNNGGIVILSGIIHSRADSVLSAYSQKFALGEVKKDGEWQGMTFIKRCTQ